VSRSKNPKEDDFSNLLRRGLSGNLDYITLKQKSRSPVFLQFKPFVQRINSQVIYIGGKLSAFPDKESQKFLGLETGDQVNLLKAAWKKLPQDRVNQSRVGSNAGFHVVAGYADQTLFETRFDKGHMIHKLLEAIEEGLGIEIDNKNEVVGYLSLKYHQQLPHVFAAGVKKTKDRLVGKKSNCLIGQELIHDLTLANTLLVDVGLLEKLPDTEDDAEDDEDQDEAA
jgi:hypothetical protein